MTLPTLRRRSALALVLLLAACGAPELTQGYKVAPVPREVFEHPPPFDVLPPGRDVPPEFARFLGIWVADAVDGQPLIVNGRTVIAVTYVAADGGVRAERAETALGGLLGDVWRWRVSPIRGRIVRGTLALDAERWLTLDVTYPPVLREHFHADLCGPACDKDMLGLVFTRVPP
jgi:hypothetical protein